jgi:uncharacterized protein (UPF0276 family)
MKNNKWNLKDLGIGIGLRTPHYDYILENNPSIDWFEIISENFIYTQGRPLVILEKIREQYPVVMHGVSLSIASSEKLNFEYLKLLKSLADKINSPWISDHLCWTGFLTHNAHDLLPFPLNEESLKHVISRVKTVMDFLERPLAIENVSSYAEFANSSISEWDFLTNLAKESDCALLLDVNNVYVNAYNHGFSAETFISSLPHEHVVQYHLAGHSYKGKYLLDTHNNPVIDKVWDLYNYATSFTGSRATLLEWDADIPNFETVHQEALKAKQYQFVENK